jgi:predicted small metal-binding protein
MPLPSMPRIADIAGSLLAGVVGGRCLMKELRCSDVNPECDFRMEGKDESEVMAKATEHARRDHGMAEIPPEIAQKAQAAIREK